MGFKEHYKEMNESKGIFNELSKGELKFIKQRFAELGVNEVSLYQYEDDDSVIVAKNGQKEILLRGFKNKDVKEAVYDEVDNWGGVEGFLDEYNHEIRNVVLTDLGGINEFWKRDGLVEFLKSELKDSWQYEHDEKETDLDFDDWLKDIYGFNDFKNPSHLNEYMENNLFFNSYLEDLTSMEDVTKIIKEAQIKNLKLNEEYFKEFIFEFYLEDDVVTKFFGHYNGADAYQINTSKHMFTRVDL